MVAIITRATTSFSEDVEVAETSYQMWKFYHFAMGEGVTSFTKGNNANFSSEKW